MAAATLRRGAVYQTLTCEACALTFTRPRKRGRAPRRCDPCRKGSASPAGELGQLLALRAPVPFDAPINGRVPDKLAPAEVPFEDQHGALLRPGDGIRVRCRVNPDTVYHGRIMRLLVSERHGRVVQWREADTQHTRTCRVEDVAVDWKAVEKVREAA